MWPNAFKRFIRKAIGDREFLLEEMPNCPDLFQYYREMIRTGHERVRGGWRWQGRFYPDFLTVGGAVYGAIRHAQKYCFGKGLDIGASAWPFPGAQPIDPALGDNSLSLHEIPLESQDYVFSSHTLEHIEDWRLALREWLSKIKPRGILFIYLPHPECGLWRMENPFMAAYHKWVPTPEIVKSALTEEGCEILAYDDGPDLMQSFFVCARRP